MLWRYFMYINVYVLYVLVNPSASRFQPLTQRKRVFSWSCAVTMAGVGRVDATRKNRFICHYVVLQSYVSVVINVPINISYEYTSCLVDEYKYVSSAS